MSISIRYDISCQDKAVVGENGDPGDGRYEYVSGRAKGCRTSEIEVEIEV